MSSASGKPASPSPNALALYAFLEQEWAAMNVAPTTWCRQVGIPDPTVYRWKTGVEPDMKSLRRVAQALGRPVLDVLVAAKYVTKAESGGHSVARREYSVLEAIEWDKSISEAEREAIRQLHEVFTQAQSRANRSRTRR